jgi:predicted deacylase
MRGGVEMSNALLFKIHQFYGSRRGINLLVLGAIHGNEPCGSIAILKVIDEISNLILNIDAGSVTFIPICNPPAFKRKRRFISHDLNRSLSPIDSPKLFEEHIMNILCETMNNCDVLLDLHSYKAIGKAAVFVGPENNDGPIEPFNRAREELWFAQSLGVDRMVYGWLPAYHQFTYEQNEFLDSISSQHQSAPRVLVNHGIGTTEYFRSLGKYGVTLECGNSKDPESIIVACNAIRCAMSYLGISRRAVHELKGFKESFRIAGILIRKNERDVLMKPSRESFAPIRKDDVIGILSDGTRITAKQDGAVIFSYKNAKVGKEWAYISEVSGRGLTVSR